MPYIVKGEIFKSLYSKGFLKSIYLVLYFFILFSIVGCGTRRDIQEIRRNMQELRKNTENLNHLKYLDYLQHIEVLKDVLQRLSEDVETVMPEIEKCNGPFKPDGHIFR